MDAKEKLLGHIEERLTVYANWINQGGGIRSDASEDLYRELLNTAMDYDLQNMNWVEDNFPSIDLGDGDEGLAVQVTSTGTAEKVKRTLTRFYTHGLEKDYTRLIVLIAGKAECKNRQFDHPGVELEIWGTAELMQELRKLSMKKLREVDTLLTERVDAPQMRRPVLHLPVPERRNPVGFLGRKKELDWINGELKEGTKPVVVAGLGGVGKTALTVQFAKKCWKGQVYFATFKDTFTRTLADSVGQAIPAEERKGMDEKQTAELALSYLRRCEPGDLLILDNAEVAGQSWAQLTGDLFYEKLRRLSMVVLMTTRYRDTGGIWLGRLAQDDLREIFRRHGVSIANEDMDALIEAVDGHTMTVDMIARTIRESWGKVKAKDILTAINKSILKDGKFEEIESDHDREQRQIYAHLRALFDLSGIAEDGRYALRCATLLPQGGMDAGIFSSALTEDAARAIKKLEKLGWVDLKGGLVSIHPVVRLVCKTELEPTEKNCKVFLYGVKGQHDPTQFDVEKLRQMAELFENADDMLENETSFWAGEAGCLWNELVEPKRALTCNLRAVEKREKNRPDTNYLAAAYSSMGLTYRKMGDHKLARKYLEKALRIREKRLPKDHLDLAASYNDVGQAYCSLCNYDKALEVELKALDIRERVLNTDHPDLASSYDTVGYTYRCSGECDKALEYTLKAIEIRERILDRDHLDLARSYSNLGITYGKLGDYERAMEYQMKALRIKERVLDENHLSLSTSYTHVGITYGRMGDNGKWLEYSLKALVIRKQILQENSYTLALTFRNVAEAYYAMGRIEDAAVHMRRAAEIVNHSTLPPKHKNRGIYCKRAAKFEREVRQRQGEE